MGERSARQSRCARNWVSARTGFIRQGNDSVLSRLIAGAVGFVLRLAIAAAAAGLNIDGRQRAGAVLAVVKGAGIDMAVDALVTVCFVLHTQITSLRCSQG